MVYNVEKLFFNVKMITVVLLHIFLNCNIINSLRINDTGVCKVLDKENGNWLECCQGYRLTPYGNCENCPDGTFGKDCKDQCEKNYYGLRCLEMCNCSVNQSCDRKIGCVQASDNDGYSASHYGVISFIMILLVILFCVLVICLRKRSKTLRKYCVDCKVPAILSYRRIFIPSVERNQEYFDDGNLYAEIRESRIIQAIAMPEGNASFQHTSYINQEGRHDHPSSSASNDTRSDEYVKVKLRDNVNVDTSEQPVKSIDSKMSMIYELASAINEGGEKDTEDNYLIR